MSFNKNSVSSRHRRSCSTRPSYGAPNIIFVVCSLVVPFQPAGASRGQGVRVAWTLDQILCAQKTMGGRVAQKYVEMPLLLPRRSRNQRLPEGSACLDRGIHRRRCLKPRLGSIHAGETMGLECCSKTRRWGEVETTGVHSPDTCEAVDTCWDQRDDFEKEPTISNEGTGSPSGRPEYDTPSYAGDAEHDPGASAGERKFDIRTWVLVTGWDPLEAFVFDEVYLRVCPQSFTLNESKFAEPQVHLTNIAARRPNKHTSKDWNGQCQRQERGQHRRRSPSAAGFRAVTRDKNDVQEPTDTTTSEVETEGFLASQAELIRRLGEMDEAGDSRGTKGRGEEEIWARGERLWRTKVSPSIEGVVRSTLFAARPHVRPRAPSFQLFGFDLILDRQLRPCESSDNAA